MKRPTFLQATGALRCLTLACVMAASSLGWQGASAQSAQSYPSRPMRMIIPFSPGGAADILGCSLSEPLGKRLGQPVLIINRDGAGTVIGVNEAAHASRDGYTLLFSGDAAIINMASGRKLPYDLFKDLAPVSIAYSGAQAMVVRRSGPFNTLQDLVKYGREKPGQVKFDWKAVMAHKDGLIKEFADYRVQQLNSGKFDFIRARARFTDPHTLALSNGRTVTAKHFILSTGSVVAESPLPQLSEIGFLTSDDALRLERLPKSIVILGGGAVAIEFAQLFARFDVEVTLIQRGPHVLKECDVEAAQVMETVFRREGIQVFTNTSLLGARRDGGHKRVTFLHEGRPTEVGAEEILFALGRTPNTESLQLHTAGVETESRRIVTNAHMQTTAGHIYAAGDCTGPHEIVHVAIQQAEIAAYNITHPKEPRSIDYRLLVYVVFTEPQFATVGLSEKEARRQGVPYVVASYPFNDHGKSLIMEARDGFVKLLAHPGSSPLDGRGFEVLSSKGSRRRDGACCVDGRTWID